MSRLSLVAPVPTPFDDRGEPSWSLLAPIVRRLAPHVDAYLLYGSTGESVHLSPVERAEGLARVRDIVATDGRGKPLWVGVLEETLAQASASAHQAIEAGARVLLVTPPRYYGGGARRDVALDYYHSLADLAGGAGRELWLYHVPQMSKVDLPLEITAELSQHPAINGIKDSSGVLARLAFYRSQRLPLTPFTGHAPTLLGALALGAAGTTLAAANVAPRGYRALLDAWGSGDLARASELQDALEPLGRIVAKDSITLVKDALRAFDVQAGAPRRPYPARSVHWAELEPVLDALRSAALLE